MRSLGAVDVIDHTTADVASRGAVFDVVFDTVGRTSTAATAAAMSPGGRFLSVNHGTPRFTGAELTELTRHYDAGVLRPVVDRVYPLERMVEAHRYVETGHERGNVVVTVAAEAEEGG